MTQPSRPVDLWVRFPAYPPRATYAMIAVLVGIYIAQIFVRSTSNISLMDAGAKINSAIIDGQYWRLISFTFLHGNLLHLAVNSFSLYSLGKSVEGFWGPWRWLIIFVLSGLAGGVASFCLLPFPSSGAAGSIFGLVGAELVFLRRNRQFFGERGHRAWQNLIITASLNFIAGSLIHLDVAGLVGGLLCGLILGWFIGPVWILQQVPMPPEVATLSHPPGIMAVAVDQQPLNRNRWLESLAIILVLFSIAVAVAEFRR